MEPRIAEAERLGLQLRELADADGGDQPASQPRQQPSSAAKRKRTPEEQASGALEQRSANTPRASNSGKRRRRLSPGSSPRSLDKLRADAGKECSIQ